MYRKGFMAALAATAVLPPCWSPALAAGPITVVVPFAAGASADTTMRLITQQITKTTGQMFIVDNRPGGNGIVGAEYVKRAPPDGQTLFEANVGSHAINEALYDKLPYSPLKDFTPVTLLWRFPSVLAVPAASKARNVAELVALGRASPSGLSYASGGVGSGGHLLGEMFKAQTDTPMLHVPYKGAAPAIADLIGNRTDFFFVSYGSVFQHVEDGKLRLLAVAADHRLESLPAIPTMAQAGFPNVQLDAWFGIVAPAGTPAAVVRQLNDMLARAARSPAIVQQLNAQGIEAATDTPAEFAALMAADTERLGRLVKAVGAKAD